MNSPDTPQPDPHPALADRPGGMVKGPWVVAATLSLFVIVPLFVVGLFRVLESSQATDAPEVATTLVWADRSDWPRTFYTTFKSMERGPMSSARTNEKYKDLGFHVSPQEQIAVNRAEALAKQSPEQFQGEPTRVALEALLADLPELFYAHFLLAQWHGLNGNTAEAEQHHTLAFRHAPAAVTRRQVDADETPLAGVAVPTVGLVADQIVNDKIDGSLVLIYPYLRTDADGFIYLPTYKAILRETDPGLPAGVIIIPEKPRWFTFYGQIGRRPDLRMD